MNDTNLLDDLIESVFVFFVSYKTSVCSIESRLNGRSRVETKFRGLPVAPCGLTAATSHLPPRHRDRHRDHHPYGRRATMIG